MDKKTTSLLVMLAALGAAELGLRAATPAPEPKLPAERPVGIILGTSRARGGLSPRVLEEELFQGGIYRPWIANASTEGATGIGLVEVYEKEIRPLLGRDDGEKVVIAIEVRGSGLNDNHIGSDEEPFLAAHTVRDGEVVERGVLATFGADGFAPASRALLSGLSIARGSETMRPWIDAVLSGGDGREDAATSGSRAGQPAILDDGPLTTDDVAWADHGRGWWPYPDRAEPNHRYEMWKTHYTTEALIDYRLGGLQTDYLRALIRRVQDDGCGVLLFNMPVTDMQRGFYRPGDYERYLDHVQSIADEAGVRFVDLDALRLSKESFVDTHHLRRSAADPVSRELARRGLLDVFRE